MLVGESAHDLFGWSVALSKDSSTVAVGAIDQDANGSAAGQVRLYRLSSASGLQPTGVLNGAKPGDYFGYSVSLSNNGSIVAIGAPGNHAGKVSVFQYGEDAEWSQMGAVIQYADTNGLGHIVALSEDGSTLVAGAPDAGLALVLQYDAIHNAWREMARLEGDMEESQFGYAVAIAGDMLAIGAKNHNSNQGQVQVLQKTKQSWALVATILGEQKGDYFGFSLSLSANGGILAVGSPYCDSSEAGRDAGLVQVYKVLVEDDSCSNEEGTCSARPGSLVPLGQTISGDNKGDLFGYSVALSSDGNRLAVGARQVQQLTGQVKVYDWDQSTGTWKQSAMPIDGASKTDQSGFSIALSGDGENLAIGSPYHDVTSTHPPKKTPNVGQARIFSSVPFLLQTPR